MLENNNLKICRRLIWRDIKFHKGSSILLITAIALVCMLYSFSLALGGMVRDGYIHTYKMMYGSNSHIIFYDLSNEQALRLQDHIGVKDSVRLSAIGVLSDDMMEYRNVKLAEASSEWAKMTEALPVNGRMPEEKDEIALDELTMNSLAIPHEIGTKVTLTWTTPEGEKCTDDFRLSGWWDSLMGQTETCAWITPQKAQELYPDIRNNVTLGVTLYHPKDLEEQAEEILTDLGLQNCTFTTNLAYNEARLEFADSQAMDFYQMNLIVVLCGMLMIYNIVRIHADQNIRFYGRVKSLGMTPRQIRILEAERAAFFCLPAILPGWLAGFLLYAAVSPYVVIGMEKNPAFSFLRLRPFIGGALFTFATTLTACFLPIRKVAKSSPMQALHFVERKHEKGRKKRKHRRTTIWMMAVSGFARRKGQSVLAAFSLMLSLIILCSIWTQAVSYDEEKYVSGVALNDYRIEDASATMSIQRYNPKSRSITPELLQKLLSHPAVTGIGAASTMEVPMYADETSREQIIDTFEGKDESGMALKEYMSDNPYFLTGYEKMRSSGEYIGIVTGVSGLMLENAMAQNFFIEGSFQPEEFASGDYVIASGASSYEIKTTPPARSKVMINGREFEIMAVVPYESTMISGADSKEAQFNVTYYMPMEVFDELFPDHGIRNAAVNIDHGRKDEFEDFLAQLLEGTGVTVTSYTDQQWNFHNAIFHNYMIPLFVGGVMLLIGILNFCNALVTGVLVRKKEFAVYESLGMAGKQLRRLLLWEGILYLAVMHIFLIPVTAAITWIFGRWWLAHTNTWCITWRFSLMPLWVTIPVLLVLAVSVPLFSLKAVTKESVTQRLHTVE
ncbi:MAG: FtsX-like permease family protein [Lachnospiraceae bacterium]|nr:FtsX-like permease family protein [Lachnospiraceae bacterium]